MHVNSFEEVLVSVIEAFNLEKNKFILFLSSIAGITHK